MRPGWSRATGPNQGPRRNNISFSVMLHRIPKFYEGEYGRVEHGRLCRNPPSADRTLTATALLNVGA